MVVDKLSIRDREVITPLEYLREFAPDFNHSEFNRPEKLRIEGIEALQTTRSLTGLIMLINSDVRNTGRHSSGMAFDVTFRDSISRRTLTALEAFLEIEKLGIWKAIGLYPQHTVPGQSLHLDIYKPGRWVAYYEDRENRSGQSYVALNEANVRRYCL